MPAPQEPAHSPPPRPHPLDEIPPSVQERGAAYWRAGRVEIESSGENHLEARVAGSKGRTYKVTLRSEEGAEEVRLAVHCTCPFAGRSRLVCKHIWAALLAMGESGWRRFFGGPAEQGRRVRWVFTDRS